MNQRQEIIKRRRQRALLPISQAARTIRNPGDLGYEERHATNHTKDHKLTMRMVTGRFTAFAQEFRGFSNAKTNQAVGAVAQKYDSGIGPVSYQFQLRDGRDPDNMAMLRELNNMVEAEKVFGDWMIRILSFGAYWSRITGKDLFLSGLNRCAVRAILENYFRRITLNSRIVQYDANRRPPPLVEHMILEFWKASERFNKEEVHVLAWMVPREIGVRMPLYSQVGLRWTSPAAVSAWIEEYRKKLLPLKMARHQNDKDLKGRRTMVERVWAQDPKSWKKETWEVDPRNPLSKLKNAPQDEAEIQGAELWNSPR